MLKGHLSRVIYHQVYLYTKINPCEAELYSAFPATKLWFFGAVFGLAYRLVGVGLHVEAAERFGSLVLCLALQGVGRRV